MAVDAAMMELQGANGWFTQLKTSTGYHNAMSVASCTPSTEKWGYPKAATATGLLKRVLDNGVLRVAGVKWSKGSQADYKTDPLNPTGFWPEYMKEIVAKLVAHYGKPIALKRVYYVSSVLVGDNVADGTDDMSEPYYYLGGFHDEMPRIEALAFSCITAGLPSYFFTKASSTITSTDKLYAALGGPNKAVGFIGQGNYDSVSHLLPPSPAELATLFYTNSSDMEANVDSGALVAGYNSEGDDGTWDYDRFHLFETGIVSPRVALFRKPSPTCSANVETAPELVKARDDLATAATETARLKDDLDTKNEDYDTLLTGSIVVLVILAVVLLLTASVIIHLIRMEKKGSPLFMPLMSERGVEAVTKGPTDANAV
jgi:hypothetical protein